MKLFLRRFIKLVVSILALPLAYLLISLVLGSIPINNAQDQARQTETIYISTNGVHLDIILAKEDAGDELLNDLEFETSTQYLAFGWGDKDFYLNTPHWSDLELSIAFKAMFLKSKTLMHVSPFVAKRGSWTKVSVSKEQLNGLVNYLHMSFRQENNHKIQLTNYSYDYQDSFYEANGSYSCFKTCNTWVNMAFKQNGLRACLWTPFDFALLNMYRE